MLSVIAASLLLLQNTTVKVSGRVGDTYTYQLTTQFKAVGATGEAQFSARFKEKLVKISGSEFHWQSSFSDVVVTDSGVLKGMAAGFQELDDFEMISIQNERAQPLRVQFGELTMEHTTGAGVVLPPSGTKVGGKWPATLEAGGRNLTIEYTLAGFESLDGRAVVKITGDFPGDQIAKALKPTTFWVDVSTGKMVKGTAETQMTAEGLTLILSYEIKLLPAEKSAGKE